MAAGEAKDFTDMTSFLCDYGPFQVLIITLLSLCVIPLGYMAVVVVFVSATPEFYCKSNQNESSIVGPEGCPNYQEHNLTEVSALSNDTQPCTHGWEFKNDTYASTIVTEWSLVCGDAWKVPFSTSVYFVGVLIGAFVGGLVESRSYSQLWPYKPWLLWSKLHLSTGPCFVSNCFRGFGQTACYAASTILGSEILSPKSRMTFSLLCLNVAFGVGYAMLALFGFLIRDWRMLLVACAVPGFLVIPLWWVIPESPRWLLQKKRFEEAEAIVYKAAKMNHVPVPEIIFKADECLELTKSAHGESRTHTCLDLLRTSNIRILTILASFVCVTVFFGLSLSMNGIDGNVHLNFLYSALIDIAVDIVAWILVDRISRPVFLVSALLLCAIFLLAIPLVPDDLNVVFGVLALCGRAGATATFALAFVYFVELMPTVLRNTALGVYSTFGRIGAMICPYIAYLSVYNKTTPYIVFGTCSVLAAALAVFFPDTRNRRLPDLISQMQPVKRHCFAKESAST